MTCITVRVGAKYTPWLGAPKAEKKISQSGGKGRKEGGGGGVIYRSWSSDTSAAPRERTNLGCRKNKSELEHLQYIA